MKFSVLTIGDEICIGQVINSNSAFISEFMTNIGYSVYMHSTVPDDAVIMKSELEKLISGSEVVIITGGLGPTHDDITKGVLTEYFNDELIIHRETLSYLESWFESRNRKMTDVNRAQALVPSKSRVLRNRVGTAPGILFDKDQKLVLALPGVPTEMKYIIQNDFLPIATEFFKKYSDSVQLYLTIKTAGIFESNLADLIGKPDEFPEGANLAYLPSAGSVRLRIGSRAKSRNEALNILDKMKQHIIDKAGKFIIGYGNETMESVLGDILKQKKLTLSVAESCTGGLLGEWLTRVSGSSEYFVGGIIAYSNEVKNNNLKVNRDTINTFGAVSQKTAIEMAQNIRSIFHSDIGISITGIAGPEGGTDEKPVGTVWIGISNERETTAKLYNFGNDRLLNRERAASKALELIRNLVLEL
ncbi:MAG: competence/damage-inducible protein A [Candidatus Kapabacteria bacterium]|nr:competence/damage-inducible protein A [Ignavibacteriota bacterium]MCW5885837.1 competence/damage-inducible protein A [Candidatus Kapabacteria bacterium]